MRMVVVTVLCGALAMLGACGPNAEEKKVAADQRAAGFTPPSVTSRVDFGGMMDRRFRTLDRNADDRITKDELPSPNARIKAFDRNKDGVITEVEWSEGTLRWFDRMDLNHDGTVTSEERAEARKREGR